jgi:HTH-type transcriptional regulator / antitoxin HipB
VQVTNADELGRVVRERRLDLGLSQSGLATAAGVSRRWLLDLESGKPTAQVGLVLRTLDALGLAVDIDRPAPPPVDLDELLARHIDGPSHGPVIR